MEIPVVFYAIPPGTLLLASRLSTVTELRIQMSYERN